MGQIAEDMIDGTTCSLCGQYFVDPDDDSKLFTHGYPVLCKQCFRQHKLSKGYLKTNHIQKASANVL